MAIPLTENPTFPAIRPTNLMELARTTNDTVRLIQRQLSEHAVRLNDELLVMTDWLKIKDADYTVLPTDRVIIVIPTANRVIELPDPNAEPSLVEPHPITVMHAGTLNTVTIDPVGAVTIDTAATLVLTAGQGRTTIPLTSRLVASEGVGATGWISISAI